MRNHLLVLALLVEGRGVGVEVVKQPTGLVLLGIEPGEAQQATLVVPGIHDLWLDAHLGAGVIGLDGQLFDIKAEFVESLYPLVDAPAFGGGEGFGSGELDPEGAIGRDDAIRHLNRIDFLVKASTGSEVEELPGNIDARDLQVIFALAVRETVIELTRFGIHEIGGKRSGVTAEERVGERDIAPEEADHVQSHQKHGERIDGAGRSLWPQRL